VALCLNRPPVGDFGHVSTLRLCWIVHPWATLVMHPPLGDIACCPYLLGLLYV